MPLLLKTHYLLAKQSLRRTRVRTFLTCLGIAIGVSALVLILSLMGSISALVQSEVSALGEGLVVVRPSSAQSELDGIISELSLSSSLTSSSLTLRDLQVVKGVENVEYAAPVAISSHTITAYDQTIPSVPVLATTPDFLAIQSFPLSSGIFLSSTTSSNSVVLGASFASRVFGNESPVGKTISFLGERFIIIGVLAKIEDPINFNNIDLDSAIIVNATHYSTLNAPLQISQLNIRVGETSKLSSTLTNIKSTLTSFKSDDSFKVLAGSDITHPSGSLLSLVTYILALVSAISLVVGGVGVMNIMLVAVAERTHEIGIRKAVGATSGHIFGEFLIESLLLTFKGGLLGIALGYIFAFFICLITPFNPYISWQILALTFGTSLLTGLIFGLVPALHAAHKDPIRSLKSYY